MLISPIRCAAMAILAAGVGASAATAATLKGFEAYVAFGDSLSDDGLPFAGPDGVAPPDPPYFQGRWTNGPVWTEGVAAGYERKGLLTANYAYGFANALRNDDRALGLPRQIPDLPDQVDLFAADAGRFAGRRTTATIWAGNNDILTFAPFVDPATLGRAAAASVVASALSLAAFGVDHVALLNLPDFSLTPRYQLLQTEFADEVAAGSAAFNETLAALIPGLRASGLEVTAVDVNFLFGDLVAHPGKYGVANAVLPCVTPTPAGVQVCPNPDDFAFFDDIHPTAAIHAQIGDLVAAEIAPVPLPAAALLLLGGLAALAGLRPRRA